MPAEAILNIGTIGHICILTCGVACTYVHTYLWCGMYIRTCGVACTYVHTYLWCDMYIHTCGVACTYVHTYLWCGVLHEKQCEK